MLDGTGTRPATPASLAIDPPSSGRAAPRARRATILRATKAETLAALRVHAPALVPDLVHFPAVAWRRERAAIVRRVLAVLHGERLAVRSAAHGEDHAGASRAGHFRTVLDVPREPAAIGRAVDAVIASYEGHAGDRVLVQDMVRDVVASGVVVTRDPVGGGPYLVFEYDESGTTDAVTRGATTPRRAVVHRSVRPRDLADRRLRRILVLAHRIERLAGRSALDLEVAQRRTGRLAVLQVRALAGAGAGAGGRALDRGVDEVLAGIACELARRSRPQRGLAGGGTILGQMPDWNPAELIGSFPSPLAASLFAWLVGDDVWQRARAGMGYRAVPGVALMTILGGRPWVDVRASFNSFLPRNVDDGTAGALVDAWLDRLRRHTALHDAVELEIAQTVRDFAFRATHAARYAGVLTRRALAVYEARLAVLTTRVVDPARGASLERALAAARRLDRCPRPARGHDGALRHALALLEGCRTHGTLPFAVVARHAFVAEALLCSAVARGALDAERVRALRASIRTVASEIAHDFAAAASGRLARERFLARWGHLRPGSFDVTSRRYDARSELFDDLPTALAPPARDPQIPFVLAPHEARALDALCREHALHVDGAGLVAYAARAVAGREHVKLQLSRPLSAALEALATWAVRHGLDREALAYSTLDELRAAGDEAAPHVVRALAERSAERRDRRVVERAVRLGPLLRDARDLHVLPDEPARPSFVTRQIVSAVPLVLDAHRPGERTLARRVVCIASADPGYDWIFAQPIAALVTCFGGGNSHMAIRCLELGVPAAIGVGEPLFDRICGAPRVELRCHDRLVRCLGRDASV